MKKIITHIMFVLLMNLSISTIAFAEGQEFEKPTSLFSESVIMMDKETGSVLYNKNSYERMYPASITKIATAIYAIEQHSLDEMVTVSENAADTEGSTVYLLANEQMTLRQLLLGLMVNSGNDAAVAIAEHVSGTEKAFMDELNEYLSKKVGVENTHFSNPHGLFNENHYTTAYDMALITKYALQNETFQELFNTKEVKWTGEGWSTTLFNHHRLVKGEIPYKGITGGKNGFVDEARHTLVTTAENENSSIIVVTLNAQSKGAIYKDTLKLLDYGLHSFTRVEIPKDTEFTYGENVFIANEDIPYSKPIDGFVDKEINEDGLLSLFTEDNELILSVELMSKVELLEQAEASPVFAPLTREPQQPFTEAKRLVLYPIVVYGILMLIAGVVFYRNKRNSIQ